MEATTQHEDTRLAFERWLHTMHSPAHARRTAALRAAFLQPHLKPGMRLLDAGCGPGSITVGLAEAVAPGEVVGVDRSDAAVDAARALATQRGCANVRFEVGSVYALPYGEGAFDAAFVHALLQHLGEPVRALTEIRRVLKPGGVIGVADADHDGAIFSPPHPAIARSTELLAQLRTRNGGGDARVGKRLRTLLHEAGFSRTVGSATAGYQGTSDATKLTGAWQAHYFSAPEFVEHVVALGLADRASLAEMSDAWRAWGADPSAFSAAFWCEAVGWAE